jgi:hypothetical protein
MIDATIDEPVNSQARLIFVAGTILIRLQFLENVVKLCCSFMEVDDKKATFENIFSEDPNRRHYTLGALIKLLKNPTCFKESFVSRLDEFVHNRNKLIHNLWLENGIYSLDEKLSNDKFLSISEFLDKLSEETDYMTRVFIGFNYSIGVHIAQREGKLNQFESDPEYTGMKEYVPLFLSVVESG